jgi:hypothetical protein
MLPFIFLWVSLAVSVADQTVYLDRFGLHLADVPTPMYEPIFNPKSINANVGEQINFIARFADISSISVL